MKRITLTVVALFAVVALGACGNSPGDRALSGGGLGAIGGAIGGAMVGAPLEGAVIGGAIGAGAGALTSPNQINLGKPIWR